MSLFNPAARLELIAIGVAFTDSELKQKVLAVVYATDPTSLFGCMVDKYILSSMCVYLILIFVLCNVLLATVLNLCLQNA